MKIIGIFFSNLFQIYSRAIVLTNKQNTLSLVILEPFNQMAMDILENQISMFELSTDFSEYPVEHQGSGSLMFPSFPPLDESFDLAIPLQSFGSVSVFDRSDDFPRKAFGCDQPLHISMMFQDARNFNLASVLKANFHDHQAKSGGDGGGDGGQSISIKTPFLFYIKTSETELGSGAATLIHLFGRVSA